MSISIAIIALGGLIFLAHILNALFEHIKIPSVLILICLGIFIGPEVMKWVEPADFGKIGGIFTTVTLIVILFESGTGLSFQSIKKSIGSATILTIVNFIKTIAIAIIILFFLTDLDILSCILTGAIIGGTSSAVVIPLVRQLKLGEKTSAVLFLESALSDVLCLIVALAVLESMLRSNISVLGIASGMIISLVVAIAVGVILGVIWAIFQRRVLQNMKNTIFASFALAFIIYGMCDIIGINGGIAVLAFGIVLGNIEYFSKKTAVQKFSSGVDLNLNETERSFFAEIGFILQTYFFVYVGLSLKFSDSKTLLIGAILTLAIFIGRQFVVRIFVNKKSTPPLEREMIALMTPKGLVAAVLASMPLQMGLPQGAEIQGIAYSVVFFSIIVCSLLAARTKKMQFAETDIENTNDTTKTEDVKK